jgi:hypothetical protein
VKLCLPAEALGIENIKIIPLSLDFKTEMFYIYRFKMENKEQLVK